MFNFGIPKKVRTVKVEKYPNTPVITMLEIPESGKGYKFDINPKAQEMLGLELIGGEKINFAFVDDDIYVAKLDEGLTVTMTGTVSNKPMYDYITKILSLDNTVMNEFEVFPHEGNLCKIKLMESDSLQEIDNLNQIESEVEQETFNEIN